MKINNLQLVKNMEVDEMTGTVVILNAEPAK